jgi:hypothetical protein
MLVIPSYSGLRRQMCFDLASVPARVAKPKTKARRATRSDKGKKRAKLVTH